MRNEKGDSFRRERCDTQKYQHAREFFVDTRLPTLIRRHSDQTIATAVCPPSSGSRPSKQTNAFDRRQVASSFLSSVFFSFCSFNIFNISFGKFHFSSETEEALLPRKRNNYYFLFRPSSADRVTGKIHQKNKRQ